MTRPLIYICYGMPKSGATFAFTLTRAVFEDGGVPQDRLEAPDAIGTHALNYVPVIRPTELNALFDAVANREEVPVAVKTHSGLWGCVERALDGGHVAAQAVCRDPRDIAVSMLEAAPLGDHWSKRNGETMLTPMQALPAVKAHVEKFSRWAARHDVLVLPFDDLHEDAEGAAAAIAERAGVTCDPARVAQAARSLPNPTPPGQTGRWRQMMTTADRAAYDAEFGPFIAAHRLGRGRKGKSGLLTRVRDRFSRG